MDTGVHVGSAAAKVAGYFPKMNGLRGKRAFDLLAVVFTVPLWLPLLGMVAVLVRWKLGAPVFFFQKRLGYRETIFEMIKFRTMRLDAGEKLTDAERLNPFGRWLRSTSLDELPELINILRGDMSLVGPRPLLIQYLPRYSPEQRRRHEVPLGLTGWAQIHGRNALSWEDKFALDVWYVDHRGFWLDLRILGRTIWQIVLRRGISAPNSATMPEFMASPSSPNTSRNRPNG